MRNWQNKKLRPVGGVSEYGEWGMGKKLTMPNAQCTDKPPLAINSDG